MHLTVDHTWQDMEALGVEHLRRLRPFKAAQGDDFVGPHPDIERHRAGRRQHRALFDY